MMQPIDAGDLTERIQLERDVISYQGGAEIRTPTTYLTVWAKIEDIGGSEAYKGESVAATGYWMFTIRASLVAGAMTPAVQPKDRVIWGGKRMEIIKVHTDAQYHTQLGLECHSNG